MATVIYYKDPQGLTGRELTTGFNGSITEFLMTIEGFDPDYFEISVNGKRVKLPSEGEIPTDDIFYRPLIDNDNVVVIAHPKGLGAIAIAAISVAASVAVTLLMPKPSIPNDMGVVKNSPNNQLNEQTNSIRAYQAIPDIYGSPVPYPDLANKSAIVEYIPQSKGPAKKQITQLMVISVGNWEVDQVYTSDTLLSQIGGTSTIYYPDENGMTTIPLVLEAGKINEVDGQELYGPNQAIDAIDFSETATTEIVADTLEITNDRDGLLKTTLDLSTLENLRAGILLDLTIRWYDVTANVVKIAYQQSKTKLNSISKVGNQWVLDFESPVDITNETFTTIWSVSGKAYEQTTVGPFTSSYEGDQLWSNFTCPQLKQNVESKIRIDWSVDNGTETHSDAQEVTLVNDEDTLESQFFTIKITSPIGRGEWTVSYTRINNADTSGSDPSSTKIEEAYVIREEVNKQYGNVTMIECLIPATTQALSLRENKINLRGCRKTITYNEETGEIDYALRRSRSFADAILHEWVEVFGQNPDALALDELYDIAENLPDPRLGYFDYTIDDIDVSLGSRIEQMANSARVFLIPDGSVYRFKRDQLQSQANLLSRRELSAEDGYEYLYKPQPLSDKDSVRVEYVDDESNTKAYIERKWDNGVIIEGVGVNPLVVQLDCVREEYSAMNRAELEIRKLYYLRTTIRDTFVPSIAMMQHKGDKVIYEDVEDDTMITGEVLAINGNVLTLSENVPDFTSYAFGYTDEYGNVMDGLSATKVSANQISVTGDISGLYVANQITNQKSSMYYLGESNPVEYIVTERKPSSDGKTISLMMTKADDRVYEFDGVIQ